MSAVLNSGKAAGSGGTLISYQIDGPERAPWLILSNSLATDRSMWRPQMAALSRSRRVLRYDTRGHGRSDSAEPPFTLEQLAGDVISLMDHLRINRAEFMGLSLGGMTGLQLAVDHPSRISRLVCADARADSPAAYREIWDGNIGRLHSDGIGVLCEPTMERWFTDAFLNSPEHSELLDGVRAMIRGTTPHGYEGVGRVLQQLDLLRRLPAIVCPVLYVVGEFDMAAPVATMQSMSDTTPEGRLVVIPGAAHLSNIEQPGLFLEAVSEFLGLA